MQSAIRNPQSDYTPLDQQLARARARIRSLEAQLSAAQRQLSRDIDEIDDLHARHAAATAQSALADPDKPNA
jgi:septal ring factor EnvC (AmiA/AmiB activator)|tara:strand:+ start:4135 stop:4350 length:216 start_codon:yes stop_codon:yes gene_type:complete